MTLNTMIWFVRFFTYITWFVSFCSFSFNNLLLRFANCFSLSFRNFFGFFLIRLIRFRFNNLLLRFTNYFSFRHFFGLFLIRLVRFNNLLLRFANYFSFRYFFGFFLISFSFSLFINNWNFFRFLIVTHINYRRFVLILFR